MPDALRDYMDGLGRRELGDGLRLMRDQVQRSGWDATVGAMQCALESTGRIDAASVAVAAARAEGGAIEYDEPVDLGVYDAALRKALSQNTAQATVLIVAQRVSTILHAQQIIVLDQGRMVGKGTHKELLGTCPEYREIAESQLQKEELE